MSTKLSRKKTVLLTEKVTILEKFTQTGEELKTDTMFEGYPVGKWAVSIRSQINRMKQGKINKNISDELLERLDAIGILNRKIEATMDEKIQCLVEWMQKYPKAQVAKPIPNEMLKEYASTDKEYENMVTEYEKVQKYYQYVKYRVYQKKLTKEQMLKAKEGKVGGCFGYCTQIEELAKKYGQPEKVIGHIIDQHGTVDQFIDLYRKGKLNKKATLVASSMVNNVFDIDLNHPHQAYDNLYRTIRGEKLFEDYIGIYSSNQLKKNIQGLKEKERIILEERFALLPGTQPKTFEEIGNRFNMKKQGIQQTEEKILRLLRTPERMEKFGYRLQDMQESSFLSEDEKEKMNRLENTLYTSDLLLTKTENLREEAMKHETIMDGIELIYTLQDKIEEKNRVPDYDQPIKNLQLSKRSYKYLRRAGIDTIGKLSSLTEKQLKQIREIGKVSVKEIISKLNEREIILEQNQELGKHKKTDETPQEIMDQEREEQEKGMTLQPKEDVSDLEAARAKRDALKNQVKELETKVKEAQNLLGSYDQVLEDNEKSNSKDE